MIFEKEGSQNTTETLKLALKFAKEQNVKRIVIASSTGKSISELAELNQNSVELICVTSVFGFSDEKAQRFPEALRAELTGKGVKLCTAGHALSGAERGLSRKFGGVYPVEIMAHTLRMFGQGTKVCVEIAVMAADAGLIGLFEPVIAIGGSENGADTAIFMRSATSANILDCKIDGIICKPKLA